MFLRSWRKLWGGDNGCRDPQGRDCSCGETPRQERVTAREDQPSLISQSQIISMPLTQLKQKRSWLCLRRTWRSYVKGLKKLKDRERRQKKTVGSFVGGFKKNKMLTEELEHKLDFYSDLPVELFKARPCLHSCSKGICF
ncbi:hypothetical protein UPYG_G00141830 [Umbra pygmaea]|uniref:Uncharacterized protein n=1 Tax=Umbra pygmaea TaxID=75934 RepID=A0ABD0WZS6_UMBPY